MQWTAWKENEQDPLIYPTNMRVETCCVLSYLLSSLIPYNNHLKRIRSVVILQVLPPPPCEDQENHPKNREKPHGFGGWTWRNRRLSSRKDSPSGNVASWIFFRTKGMFIWLVVYLPLWKIWKSVGTILLNIWKNKRCSIPPISKSWQIMTLFQTLGWWHSQYMEK